MQLKTNKTPFETISKAIQNVKQTIQKTIKNHNKSCLFKGF